MLDGLKPIAEFSLAFECRFNELALLDVDGMNIKDLYINNECSCSEAEFQLPLWKSKDRSLIKLTDLGSLCRNLVTLTVVSGTNIFRSRWIPNSIKCLKLENAFGEDYTCGRLVVPPGVEYIFISDWFEFVGRTEYDPPTASILVCVDLSRARQLKRICYERHDVSNDLIQTLRQVKDTLEWLSIECEKVTDLGTYEFQELARQGLGLKRLKLTMGSFGKELSDYRNFLTDFPELKLLEIEVSDWCGDFYLLVQRENDYKLNLIKGLIASFLHGSPKLSHIQLQSKTELNWIDSSVPCITRVDGNEQVIYDVNVCEARVTFRGRN